MSHRTPVVATLCAAVVLLTAPHAGASTVFKWTDERGVVNYTTTPPPHARGVSTVNAAPAVETRTTADEEEARYWRERRQREALREVEQARDRRERQELQQAQMRQAERLAAQAATRDDDARRALREQCLRERRVDCDNASSWSPGYYTGPVVVRRFPAQPITSAAPFPVPGNSLGPAPGTIAGTAAQLAPFRQGGNLNSGSASLRIR
ncbi:MAG: DUF4124 domain-containing protein [Burkholderiales bacterium]|nr:DUF4124 domain-containing protein [Burkholderiales bacterium]